MLQIKFVRKIKTHFISNKVFTGNRAVYEIPRNVEKYGRVRLATD
jgi:hypothetical protein